MANHHSFSLLACLLACLVLFAVQDAPYVLMANTGTVGRFNRAQRAAFNMDESLPLPL